MILLFAVSSIKAIAQTTVVFDFTNADWWKEQGFTIPAKGKSTNISSRIITYQDISITTTDGTTNARLFNSNGEYDLRIYKEGGSITFSVPTGNKIKSIVFTGTINLNELTDKKWEGEATSITFNANAVNYIETATLTILEDGTPIEKSPANLTFTPSEIELKLGETQVVEFTKATSADVTFTSSNEAVATFDAATNTVTAVGVGTTTITATSEENTEYLAGSAILTVSVKEPQKPADIAFTPSEIELKLEETQVVEFTKATTADITFTSSNEAVATFDATTNTVTAVGIGTATITATSEENTEYLAGTAMLTVNVGKTFDSDIIFYESFDTNSGSGGNDGALSGTGSGKALTDNEGWNFQKGYGASKCIKLGTGSAIGTATTPPLGYTGTVSLTFRAGAWNYEKEEITLQVTVLNGGEFIENSTLKLAKGAFTDYQLTIKGLTAGSKIEFSAAVASYNRFFLDEVKVTKLHAVLDETATEIPANADVTDVTLKRTFNANKWNPVCLPFALSAEHITALFGAESEVAEYMGDEENDGNVTVKFRKKTDGMEANVPYLIYPLNNITEAEFSAVEVVATECPVVSGTVFDLVGNYTNQLKGSSVIQKGDYIVSGGVFKQANGGNGIKAFRSYLRKKPTSNAKSLMMVFQNETSGIDSIISNLSIEEDNCIYDLQGRMVKNPVKGLYIVNGRKVIIK